MMTLQLLAPSTRTGALRVAAAAALTVALTACSAPVGPDAATGPSEPDAASSGAPTSTTGVAAGGSSNGTGRDTGAAGTTAGAPSPSPAEVDARWYDLMHVQQTAAPCTSMWTVGGVLPADYQWCADADGNPVAGVRVGPCEVVSYGRAMYAVPGRGISSVTGSIDQDQAYLGLLTSCKRTPFPAERR